MEPYFSGVAGADYTVSLCWRVYVPAEGERLWPRVSDREVVDIPIVEVREALQEDDAVCRLAADGDTVELTQAEHLRPGDQVVIPTDRGLLDCFGWTPNATGRVVDASLAGHGLPLDATAIRRLCGLELGSLVSTTLQVDEDGEPEQDGRQEAVATILEALRGADTPTGWTEDEWLDFTRALAPVVEQPRFEVPRLPILTGEAARYSNDLGSDFDELSLNAALIVLEEHGQAVGSLARQIAERIGLSETLSEVVECAGTLHDIGKADERFQRWLDPEARHEGLLAKSDTPRHRWEATRAAAGWPRGGRHEDLSGRLVRAWLEQNSAWSDQVHRDLLVHLVVSHHGKGRPLVPSAADGSARLVSTEVNGTLVEAPADLAVIDWSQPRRFRRLNDQFGPWGLALLESIVQMADHAVSASADVSRGTTG
ncbi:MAG: CRISPR-associated endonuclease Cas3'' [Chloroflexi bacterium]|nr:CRISPR-associated endonuclease Cas3'' [Chloroflexota bacterium]